MTLALGLFLAVLLRILDTARVAKTASETYFCVGAAGILGLHLFVNVGMVVGILPNKGIVLPFFSAGGEQHLELLPRAGGGDGGELPGPR